MSDSIEVDLLFNPMKKSWDNGSTVVELVNEDTAEIGFIEKNNEASIEKLINSVCYELDFLSEKLKFPELNATFQNKFYQERVNSIRSMWDEDGVLYRNQELILEKFDYTKLRNMSLSCSKLNIELPLNYQQSRTYNLEEDFFFLLKKTQEKQGELTEGEFFLQNLSYLLRDTNIQDIVELCWKYKETTGKVIDFSRHLNKVGEKAVNEANNIFNAKKSTEILASLDRLSMQIKLYVNLDSLSSYWFTDRSNRDFSKSVMERIYDSFKDLSKKDNVDERVSKMKSILMGESKLDLVELLQEVSSLQEIHSRLYALGLQTKYLSYLPKDSNFYNNLSDIATFIEGATLLKSSTFFSVQGVYLEHHDCGISIEETNQITEIISKAKEFNSYLEALGERKVSYKGIYELGMNTLVNALEKLNLKLNAKVNEEL